MNYTASDSIPYFKDFEPIVDGAGFRLVELQVVPQMKSVNVSVVIASKNGNQSIGVADCSAVHHALLPRLPLILNRSEDDIFVEVSSPGISRNIKNANEFTIFTGCGVRVWDKTVGDWLSGIIERADDNSVTLQQESGELVTVSYADIAKAKFLQKEREA